MIHVHYLFTQRGNFQFWKYPFLSYQIIKQILKDKEIKSLNHEFGTSSISGGVDSGDLTYMHNKIYATKNYQTTFNDGWLEITDPSIIDMIMKNYGDPLGRKILLCVTDTPRTIMDILLACAIPQTSGYRKILKMIEDKIVIRFDTIRKNGGKRTSRYITTFADVQIKINNKVISISARPNFKTKIKSKLNF